MPGGCRAGLVVPCCPINYGLCQDLCRRCQKRARSGLRTGRTGRRGACAGLYDPWLLHDGPPLQIDHTGESPFSERQPFTGVVGGRARTGQAAPHRGGGGEAVCSADAAPVPLFYKLAHGGLHDGAKRRPQQMPAFSACAGGATTLYKGCDCSSRPDVLGLTMYTMCSLHTNHRSSLGMRSAAHLPVARCSIN